MDIQVRTLEEIVEYNDFFLVVLFKQSTKNLNSIQLP